MKSLTYMCVTQKIEVIQCNVIYSVIMILLTEQTVCYNCITLSLQIKHTLFLPPTYNHT